MRKLILGLVLAALSVSASWAADLRAAPVVVKAPVKASRTVCTLNQCNVWFVGVGAMGMGSNLDIVGQGISNSVFANGGMVQADFGAQLWYNGIFLGVENMAGWAFGTPTSINGSGVTLTGGLDVFWLEAGGSLGDFFGSGATPVSLDSALATDLISFYFGTGPAEPLGNSSLGSASFWTSGAGARYLIPTPRPMLLDVKYVFGNNTNSTALVSNKNLQMVGATLLIPFNW